MLNLQKEPIIWIHNNPEAKNIDDLIQLAETAGIIGTNPIKFWERNKILAYLNIANKDYKIKTSELKYSLEDTKEFKIQINELLSQKLNL